MNLFGKSVKEVNIILDIIRDSIAQLNDEINQISAVIQEQAASTQRILEPIHDLIKITNQLRKLSKDLVK